MNVKRFITGIFLSALATPFAQSQNSLSTPTFKIGESFFYLVHIKSIRDIKTKSAFSFPEQPIAATINVTGILQVEVISTDSAAFLGGTRLRTWFLNLNSDVTALPRGAKPNDDNAKYEKTFAENKFVECTLLLDGQITQIAGLDELAAEQQTAWREWAAHFAGAFLAGSQARKRGEKWSEVEPESSPSPVASLLWQKKSQYVKDESCAPQKFVPDGPFSRSDVQESCAVIVTTAALLQKSSTQDSTPQDYKIKSLKTRGTEKGNNDSILYISQKNGRLIRSTQNAKQQMDVTIALADGTRQVHYAITADFNSTVELVTDLPLILQPKSTQ